MSVDEETMHQHFFYVMDNFEKLAEKVEELEQNMAAVIQMIVWLTSEGIEDE